MCLQLTDIMVVGRVSAVALSAVSIGSAIYAFALFFGAGLLAGLDTRASQAYGRGDVDATREAFKQSLILASLYGIPATLLLWLVSRFGLPAMGLNPDIVIPSRLYLNVLTLSLYPVLLFQCARQYLQVVGQEQVGMWLLIVGNIANLLLAITLVLGVGSFRGLGVLGAAIATTGLRIAAVIGVLPVIWRSFNPIPRRLDTRELGELWRLGWPGAWQMTLELGAFTFATLIVGRLSPDEIAAHQIVLNATNFSFMIPLGLSTAAAIVSGQSAGVSNFAKARGEGWIGLGLGTAFMALTGCLFAFLPRQILSLYTKQSDVILAAVLPMGIAAGFQLFDGIQTVTSGLLRGLGQTKIPAAISAIGHWCLGLPLGYYLCFSRGMGLKGIWMGFAAGLSFAAILMVISWLRVISNLEFGRILPHADPI